MRTTRTITAALCAVLGTAALAGPAAAGQQGAGDSAKANVYVPPAAVYTATPSSGTAKANVYVPPATLYTAAPATDTAKANPTSSPSSDFDWGSAGIGAGVAVAALLIGFGGAMGVRRRGQIQPAATA